MRNILINSKTSKGESMIHKTWFAVNYLFKERIVHTVVVLLVLFAMSAMSALLFCDVV